MATYVRAIIVLLALTFVSSPGYGQPFYEDKRINFVVGYSPGGIFDTYTRLIARHFAKYVPGNPSVIVQNMTGAAGMVAANHVYNIAKPDLTIGAFAPPLILQHVMGNQAARFDGRRFAWLGVPSPNHRVCMLSDRSGVKSVEEWFARQKPVHIGSIGPGTGTSDIPRLVKEAIGLPLELIEGYAGGAGARAAVERGEVDGYCGPWETVKGVWHSAFAAGQIRPIVQLTLQSHPDLKHVPLAVQYAKTEEARRLLTVVDSIDRLQFPYSVPPGTSKERLSVLQKAFIETLRDRRLLAEAEKADLEIDPIDGPTVQRAYQGLYELDVATVRKLSDILLPRK